MNCFVRVAMALALLMPVLASVAAAATPPISLHVLISKYDDSVLLSAKIAYVNTTSRMKEEALKSEIAIDTKYLNNKLLKVFAHVAFAIAYGSKYASTSTPVIKMNLIVRSTKTNSTYQTFSMSGFIDVTSEKATGRIYIDAEGDVKFAKEITYELVNLNGTVAIEKSAIPEEQRQQFVNSLKMMAAMMSPMFVNSMLAKYNITWIKVKNAEINVSSSDKFVNVSFAVTMLMNLEEYFEWLKNISSKARGAGPAFTPSVVSLEKYLEALAKVNVTSSSIAKLRVKIVSGQFTEMVIDAFTNISGDVEKLFRLESEYLYSMIGKYLNQSKALQYLTELVVLPYNTSIRIGAAGGGGKLYLFAAVDKLRLGHRYLKGDKAVQRVIEIVSSFLSALKVASAKLGIPIEVRVSTKGVELKPNPEMVNVFATTLERQLPKLIAKTTITPPPPTVTTSVITTVTTTTVPVHTSTTSAVVSAIPTTTITITLFKQLTTSTTITSYITTTLLKTLTKTLTTTVTATSYVTKTSVSTVTSTLTTTVIQTNYGLAIGLLIVGIAVGIGVGFVIRRK